MPTYEYECKTCGTVFDLVQSIKANPLRKADCPHCGKPRAVTRRISAGGGLLFKGSGFYLTDYRSESYQKAAKSESQPAGENKSDAGKGDTGRNDTGKGDTGKSDASKSDAGRSDATRGDASKRDSSKPDQTAAKPDGASASKPAADSSAARRKKK